MAPGKLGMASTAATSMARDDAPGSLLMYAPAPSLPAAATTTTPAFAALSAATASADRGSPKGEPSDRLMTSRWFLTAQSMASTTMSVVPVQPKMRRAYSVASGAEPGPTMN